MPVLEGIYDTLQKLGGLLGGLGGLGGLAALLAVLWDRRAKVAGAAKTGAEAKKVEADTVGVLVDSSSDLVRQYRETVNEMKTQIAELKATQKQHTDEIRCLNQTVDRYAERIAYLMGGIDALIRQITVQLKAVPVWTPSPWTDYNLPPLPDGKDKEKDDGPNPGR